MIVSESFVIADWTDPGTHPGRPIAALHVHHSDDEAWLVLEGQLGFRVGEEERVVPAGGSMLAQRDVNARGRGGAGCAFRQLREFERVESLSQSGRSTR